MELYHRAKQELHLTGLLFRSDIGRGEKCPAWREGTILGKDVVTANVALGGLVGGVIATVFLGGKVGRIGWMTVSGVFAGIVLGVEFGSMSISLGLDARYTGAITGGLIGFTLAVASEWYIQISRRWRVLVWAIVASAGAYLVVTHIVRECYVAVKVLDFAGETQGLLFTRYVYNIRWVDDENISELTDVLEHARFLQSLSLDGKISNDGLQHIGRLTRLRWLYLESPNVTDAGLVHLKTLVNLEYLSLHNTKVTSKGAKDLYSALPMLAEVSLNSLHLWWPRERE